MAIIRGFVIFLATAFFTAGLAVIPQDIYLAGGFIIASIILGLIAIYLYSHIRKRHQGIIQQITVYYREGIELTHNIPKNEDDFIAWVTKYKNWHGGICSWLDTISPTDTTIFCAPGSAPAVFYTGYGGDKYQDYQNTLRDRLENLHELLVRYIVSSD